MVLVHTLENPLQRPPQTPNAFDAFDAFGVSGASISAACCMNSWVILYIYISCVGKRIHDIISACKLFRVRNSFFAPKSFVCFRVVRHAFWSESSKKGSSVVRHVQGSIGFHCWFHPLLASTAACCKLVDSSKFDLRHRNRRWDLGAAPPDHTPWYT